MTNRFKSALCGHLIQKLRVKCSVMYCMCVAMEKDFVLSGLGCLLKMKKNRV